MLYPAENSAQMLFAASSGILGVRRLGIELEAAARKQSSRAQDPPSAFLTSSRTGHVGRAHGRAELRTAASD